MTLSPEILAFAGSARRDSLNKQVLAVAAEGARQAGAIVTLVDLKDYPMPIYDGDLEMADGIPEAARQLKSLFLNHEGLLIASPEYNSSFTPLLKNAIDWISRPVGDEPPLQAFHGKTAALVSASPGRYGGNRSLASLRTLLENIDVRVIAQQASLSKAHEAFSTDGSMTDATHRAEIEAVGHALARALQQAPVAV